MSLMKSWATAYHFEKYDMELSPEFRAYAIEHAPAAES